jgi:hypothetical protein
MKRSPTLLRSEVGDDADCWARDISGTWVLGRDGDRPKRRGRKGWRGIGLPGRASLLAIRMEIGRKQGARGSPFPFLFSFQVFSKIIFNRF